MDARTELDPKYIEEFVLNGIVVIPSIITPDLVEKTMRELEAFLLDQGCNPNNLEGTASTLSKLSSTNGSGGVLDVYYEAWKLRLNENPNIVGAVQSLWKHTYSSYVDDFQRNICHCRDPSEDQFITGVYPCTRKAQKSSVKVPIDNKCTCTSTCIHSGKLTTSNDHFDITGITNDKAAELTYTKGDSVSVGASAVLSSSPPEKINSSSCSLGMKSSMSVTSRSNGNHHPFEHPFGTFNASQGYMYIDRICYRIPTVYASNVGTGSTSYTCHSINTTCTGIKITGGKPETPTMNTGINTGTQASAPINTVSNSNSNNSSSSSSSSSSSTGRSNTDSNELGISGKHSIISDWDAGVSLSTSTSSLLVPPTPGVLSASELSALRAHLYECTLTPGDILYFPAMWMHATLNVDAYNVFMSVFIDPQLIAPV